MEKLINAKGAAKLLGVNQQTIYKHYESGKIPGYKLGKALRFDVNELRELMRQRGKQASQTGKDKTEK